MVATRKLRPLCRPQLREVPVRHWNNNQQVTANKLRWKKANMIHDGCTLHIFYMLFADICTHVHIHKEIIDWPSFLDDNCPEWFDWVVSLKLTFYTMGSPLAPRMRWPCATWGCNSHWPRKDTGSARSWWQDYKMLEGSGWAILE